jgi:hypothetical protein
MAKVGGAKAAELERLNGELAVARAELESLKFKYDSALSRCVGGCMQPPAHPALLLLSKETTVGL